MSIYVIIIIFRSAADVSSMNKRTKYSISGFLPSIFVVKLFVQQIEVINLQIFRCNLNALIRAPTSR